MLDLGSGNGRHTIEACRWPCRVVSVDVDAEELRKARYYLRAPEGSDPFQRYGPQTKDGVEGWADFIVADAQHLPFREGVFDKVVCTEVMEHITDDKQGISELYRVAKPGAGVAVSVPRHGPERFFWAVSWEYWHTPGGHIRIYEPGEMKRYLQQQGFQIDKVRHRHAFQSIYWGLRCTFGKNHENRLLTRLFFRFMSWYHETRPRKIEYVEAAANLILGKDMIHYGRKPEVPVAARERVEAAS